MSLLRRRALIRQVGGFPSEGLMAYYPFNGNANDESGNGNNGIVNGATLTTGRKGDANHAFLFTTGQDDYIDVSSIGNLTDITVTMWVNRISGGNTGLVWKGNTSSVGDYSAVISVNGLSYAVNTNSVNRAGVPGALTGVWQFVVMSYNSTSGLAKISFDDGVPSSGSSPALNTSGLKIYIGQYFGSGNSFNGSIDDVRFYNRELPPDELTILYNE